MRTKQLSTAARWYCCVYAHVQGSYNKRQQQFIHSVQEKEKTYGGETALTLKSWKKVVFDEAAGNTSFLSTLILGSFIRGS